MSSTSSAKHETLTARNLMDSYSFAYEAIHGKKPTCQQEDGRWFMVEGVRRDRHWLILEIERLRQEALTATIDNVQNQSKGHIFKMIRRLARL